MRRQWYWGPFASALLLLGTLLVPDIVTGQGNSYDLPIAAVTCERAPTGFPFQGGDCVPAKGAVIVATMNDGPLIGTCIAQPDTSASVVASCSISVPVNTWIIVTEDVRSIAAGYAPTNNPQTFDTGASLPQGDFAGAVFVNLPTTASPGGASSAATPTSIVKSTPPPLASGITLPPPIMEGNLGDWWTLHVSQDTFFWAVTNYGRTQKPSPRYVAQPRGAWFVVLIDVGTHDSSVTQAFPYDAFALADRAGNVYLPNLIATAAYCEAYCEMDILHQSYSGWRDHAFHQALVFDLPFPSDNFAADGSGLVFRSLDGLVAVPLRR